MTKNLTKLLVNLARFILAKLTVKRLLISQLLFSNLLIITFFHLLNKYQKIVLKLRVKLRGLNRYWIIVLMILSEQIVVKYARLSGP